MNGMPEQSVLLLLLKVSFYSNPNARNKWRSEVQAIFLANFICFDRDYPDTHNNRAYSGLSRHP